jgi:hypothetical protein
MPIRHCQKCGLKVLIDESQAGANPFYCQRCTTAMKGPDSAGDDLLSAAAAPPPLKRTPVPAPAAVAVAPPKSATVKVLCPYCKASFNGRIPQKPARGSCPVCQKELILLPNGDIRPAAGFDINQWQSEGEKPAAVKESGTKLLVKKYSAEAASAPPPPRKEGGTKVLARKAPEPPPPPPPPPAPLPPDETADDQSVALPSWLDDTGEARKSSKPPADAPMPAPETDEAAAVRLDDLPPAGPPIEDEPPPPPEPPPVAVLPPPPPPSRPQPATSRKSAAASAGRRVTERRAVPAGASGPTGTGKFMFALFLAALPVIACGVLLGIRPKLQGTVIEKLGVRFAKGFRELHDRLNPPEAKPAPKPEAPKPPPPPEEPVKPDAVEQARDENEMIQLHGSIRRTERDINQLSVGANDQQKADIEKMRGAQKEREAKLDMLVERYKKTYGKEYDPRKQ